MDYYTSDEMGETGEAHWYYLSVEVMAKEYADCENVLNTLRDQLLVTCNI